MNDRRDGDDNVIELKAKFDAFLDRYEEHRLDSIAWRNDTTERLKVHCNFINKVSPAYKGLCWVLGIIATVSIGAIMTDFCKHISFH